MIYCEAVVPSSIIIIALRSEKSEDMNTHTKVRLNIESDEEEVEEEEEEEAEQEEMQGARLTPSLSRVSHMRMNVN